MATDKNKFDDFLKAALYRDIIFRMILWGVIAGATTYFASKRSGFDAVKYFNDSAIAVAPLINSIGVVALLLAAPALLLKDLEHVDPRQWGYGTSSSWWGGAIRRLSGDLTLWVVGAFVSFLSSLVGISIVAVYRKEITFHDGIALMVLYPFIFLFIGLVGFVNVLIRRVQPPLAATPPFSLFMRSPRSVLITYAALLLFAWLMNKQ